MGDRPRTLFGDGLPVFAKFIRTDFPPLAHIGFRVRVRPEDFVSWTCLDIELLGRLRQRLRVPDQRSFRAFARAYESWAEDRALRRWRADPDRDGKLAASLRRLRTGSAADLSSLLARLGDNRARIADVLNEVDLRRQAGNLLLIKAGLLHALFGLSHQFHPSDPAQNLGAPKSEAWLPFLQGRDFRLAEVQQSSDSTCSLADFFTPFLWDKGLRFRKGSACRGLCESAVRRMIRSMDFRITKIPDILCKPQSMEPGPGSRGCRLYQILDRPESWPFFTIYRLDLLGTRSRAVSWAAPARRTFQHIVVLKGSARLAAGARMRLINARRPAFVPAELPGGFGIAAKEPASLLLISVPN
ncbi:MAG TPA: hypothetical protein DEB40_02815 [Elusimicrobia bacterium]|nr:hypothetical protein [Elusimicrobiota bacterium]